MCEIQAAAQDEGAGPTQEARAPESRDRQGRRQGSHETSSGARQYRVSPRLCCRSEKPNTTTTTTTTTTTG